MNPFSKKDGLKNQGTLYLGFLESGKKKFKMTEKNKTDINKEYEASPEQ